MGYSVTNGSHIVIIGNSAAALSALETLRKGDADCMITLISGEVGPAYSLVFLPHFISGKIKRDNLFISDPAYYRGLNAHTLFGKWAVEVAVENQEVLLDDRTKVPYDSLIICTGASANKMDFGWPNTPEVKSLRTLKDAVEIRKLLKSSSKVLAIGAGLINLKLLSLLKDKGFEFTIVEKADHVLVNMVDQTAAPLIERKISEAGIKLIKGSHVCRVRQGSGGRRWAILSNEDEIEVDLVISNTGVSPNTSFIHSDKIARNRGIVIDDYARTTIENIYAAGDVTEAKERTSGEYANIGNWFNAIDQGRIAAFSILGKEEKYHGSLNLNVTDIFDLTIWSLGDFRENTQGVKTFSHRDPDRDVYEKICVKENTLVGGILVSNRKNTGFFRSLLGTKVNTSKYSRMVDLRRNGWLGDFMEFSMPRRKGHYN
jgi:nitrite reductase (NADH) large subunit